MIEKPLKIATAIALAIWGAVLFYVAPVPIELLCNDSVTPAVVRAGETVTVTRSFRAKRDVHVEVTRVLIRGNCKDNCQIVDLYSGGLTLKAGDYRNMAREHTIPKHVGPGTWDLAFSMSYQGLFGVVSSVTLPVLSIEVVE